MSSFNLTSFDISWNINHDTSSSAGCSKSPRSFKQGVTGAELPMRDERVTGLNSAIHSGGRGWHPREKSNLENSGTADGTVCCSQRDVAGFLCPGFACTSGRAPKDQLSKKFFLTPKEIAAIYIYTYTYIDSAVGKLDQDQNIKTCECLLVL